MIENAPFKSMTKYIVVVEAGILVMCLPYNILINKNNDGVMAFKSDIEYNTKTIATTGSHII